MRQKINFFIVYSRLEGVSGKREMMSLNILRVILEKNNINY